MRSVRVLLAALVLSACSQAPEPSAQAPPPPSASPTDVSEDLGGYAPPEFVDGGMGVWTRSKFFAVHDEPDLMSESHKLKAWNPLGQRLRLLVLEARTIGEEKWFRILVPERPNGKDGWIQANPKSMTVDQLPDRIEVDLSERELEWFTNGTLAERFEVGVGEDRYPTPTGTFYVWASVDQPEPSGPYGRFALGLSGFSPVLSDWPGGGRSAIHGTADPADKGAEVSHGCVRVYNADMKKLEKIPLGTPVLIEA